MALHFILDGYNVLKKTSALADMKIEVGRETLVRLIETYQPQGSLNNPVTIIFDGGPGMTAVSHESPVRVFFTYEQSADEEIKRRVQESGRKRSLVVVTDDREIQYYVKSLGAQVMPTNDFLARLKPRRKVGRPSDPDPKVTDYTMTTKINKELSDLWLNKRKPQR